MLRNIWFYMCLIPGTLFFSLTACLFFWQKSGKVGTWSGYWWARFLVWASGVKVDADLEAMNDLAVDQGVIFMANHQSQLDILILYTLLHKRWPVFVAKESLFSLPALGQAMSAAGHIPIDRANRRKAMQSIEQAAKTLELGRSIIIFPEGTRPDEFSGLLDFKIGGVVLAIKCKALVVPLIITGSGRILPRGAKTLPAGRKRILVRALEPISAADYHIKERERFKDELQQRMNHAYAEQNTWPDPMNP